MPSHPKDTPRLPLLAIVVTLLLTLAVAGCGRHDSITIGTSESRGPTTALPTTTAGQSTAPAASLQQLQSSLGSNLTTLTTDATAATTAYSEGDQP